jgi:hypothetical protein
MVSLNRDEAVQKMAATTAKDGLLTPAKTQDDSKKPADDHSADKGKTPKGVEKAVKRTPPPRK